MEHGMGMERDVRIPINGHFRMEHGRRSILRLLDLLLHQNRIKHEYLPTFEINAEPYSIPRFVFRGPNSKDPIRLGIFAAIHGDEPAGALALVRFMLDLADQPDLAENYVIRAYPICNPTGFEDN